MIQLVSCRDCHLDAVAFADGQLQRALVHIHCKIVRTERAERGQLRQLHNIGSVICGICALRHIQPDVGSLHRLFQIKADRRGRRFLVGDLCHIRPVLAVGRNLQLIIDRERIAIVVIVRAREDHKAAEFIRQTKVNACVRDRICQCAFSGQRRPAVCAAVADDASDIAVVQQRAAPDALWRRIVGRNGDRLVQRRVFRAFGLPCAQVIAARRAKHRKLRQLHHGSTALCHIDPDILCRDRRVQIEADRRSGRGLTRHRDEICPGLAVVRGLKHIVHREVICVFVVRAREHHDPADLIRRTEVDSRPCGRIRRCAFVRVGRPAVCAVVAHNTLNIAVSQLPAGPDALRRIIVGRNADRLVQRNVRRAVQRPRGNIILCAGGLLIAARFLHDRAPDGKLLQLHQLAVVARTAANGILRIALCHIQPHIARFHSAVQCVEIRLGRVIGCAGLLCRNAPCLAVQRGLDLIVGRENGACARKYAELGYRAALAQIKGQHNRHACVRLSIPRICRKSLAIQHTVVDKRLAPRLVGLFIAVFLLRRIMRAV